MTLMVFVIWGFAVACGLTAVAALVWAIRSGQMRGFGRGATSIFDDEEPVGRMTDGFPAGVDRSTDGGEER
jgi:nitrogen fixation-related uncharacterized protein